MLLSSEEKSKTPPMLLCFKLGRPMKKSFSLGRTSSPAHACRDTQPEYWFAVPQERSEVNQSQPPLCDSCLLFGGCFEVVILVCVCRVEHLYAFLVQCSPDVYGREVHEQGFVLVEKDELNMIDNFFSDPVPRNWEVRPGTEVSSAQW